MNQAFPAIAFLPKAIAELTALAAQSQLDVIAPNQIATLLTPSSKYRPAASPI